MKMNPYLKFIVCASLLYFCYRTSAQTIRVGLLVQDVQSQGEPEVRDAYKFLSKNKDYKVDKLFISELESIRNLDDYDVLWFHHNDSTYINSNIAVRDIIFNYISEGGNLLLTLEAFRFINDLGIEPSPVETRNKTALDEGYGRQLGLHAFRSHPVFEGMNGGAYIFRPKQDTTVRINGFFENTLPAKAEVIAIDWDYIFLREDIKLAVEYKVGSGGVVAIGAYTTLSSPNNNKVHLELFLNNCIHYLAAEASGQSIHLWKYGPQEVSPVLPYYSEKLKISASEWQIKKSDIVLRKEKAETDFWDVAGERMVIMGNENAGISEIWTHPFMAFRDYKAGLKFPSSDSIQWLSNLSPSIETRPESFIRNYKFKQGSLTEIITVSPESPAGIVHYSWSGSELAEIFIRFSSNLRLMWPYSETVFKKLAFIFDPNLNAVIIREESGDFLSLIGSDKKPINARIGQFVDFKLDWVKGINHNDSCKITGLKTNEFIIGGMYHFSLKPQDELNILLTSGYTADGQTAYEEATENYKIALRKPDSVYNVAGTCYENLLFKKSLAIKSPDTVFNEGYLWALIATGRFYVHTPGLGKSLVAGYSTTGTGWDGGHKVDGRPGYAWYFGRDGEWSGFALLDCGDFEKVKSILEMYIKFQDLNGKIYHEVSTSGVVHYDAADATPLFIILAGKYLKYSGDTEFIRSNWLSIKMAIDFCFSTDTDSDHLIENTNVGHGWEEGGSLFGTHSTLYLTSCWAEALNEAGLMAKATGLNDEAKSFTVESELIKNILNSEFWNKEKQYYYQGKFVDGSYHAGRSIMPAIPMYFGQVDKDKASLVLPVIAGCNFSTDWGCRILGEDSPDFNPRSYHSGSVWPLFTGWAALAEYNSGNDVQGFAHIMNNLQVYKHWGLGYIEEVLNGETYKPSGVCRHQCWSETMVLQPAIEGMLGLEPDAVNTTLKFSPAFPADWDSVEVNNIRIGNHIIYFKMKKEEDIVSYHFKHDGPSTLKLEFNPTLPDGTIIRKITATGNFEPKILSPSLIPVTYLADDLVLEYKIEYGIKVLPLVYEPQPGASSVGMRVIDDRLAGEIYSIIIEGLQGSKDILEVYLNDWKISRIENAAIISVTDNIYNLAVSLDTSERKYVKKEIRIFLE